MISFSVIRLGFFMILLSCFMVTPSFAQPQKLDPDKATKLAEEANILARGGRYESAVKRLEEAMELDPQNFSHPLDLAKVHFMNNNFPLAKQYGMQVLQMKGLNDDAFQFVGHIFEQDGNPDKAKDIYKQGMMQFPKSGELLYRLGNVAAKVDKDDTKALELWEKGITTDPSFPMNYYGAAKIHLQSQDPIWGLLYGEIFMNLDRNSRNTAEMSALLHNTYMGAMKMVSEQQGTVTITSMVWENPDTSGKVDSSLIPFPVNYQRHLTAALTQQLTATKKPEMNMDMISQVVMAANKDWYNNRLNEVFPNVLFLWHKQLIDDGNFDAYYHWLLNQGDPKVMDKWEKKHKSELLDFLAWFKENPLQIDDNRSFNKDQYTTKKKPKAIEVPKEPERPSDVPTRPSRYDY